MLINGCNRETMSSRTEIKLKRLLHCCDSLCNNDSKSSTELWRLEKYIKGLDNMLIEMKDGSARIDHSKLSEYERKVLHFKRLIETWNLAGQQDIPFLIASDHLVVSSATQSETERERYNRRRSKRSVETVLRSDLLHSTVRKRGSHSGNDNELTTPKGVVIGVEGYTKHMRGQLTGSAGRSGFGEGFTKESRPRVTINTGDDSDTEKQLLKERNVQAAITEELVEMARALKDTTLLAGSMVKEDIETLDRISSMADTNQSKLATEGERLKKHMEVYASCWIWIALLIVAVVFVFMIIFIRIIPAPRL
eukprot:CFRG1804T1